jgi:hypothetical protein
MCRMHKCRERRERRHKQRVRWTLCPPSGLARGEPHAANGRTMDGPALVLQAKLEAKRRKASLGVSSEAGQRSDETARAAALKSRRLRHTIPMMLLGDSVGSHDRTVTLLAPADETLFEFLRELEKTAGRFPPDPRHARSWPGCVHRGRGHGRVTAGWRRVNDLRVSRLGRCRPRSAAWASPLGPSGLMDSVTVKYQRCQVT